MLPSDGVSISSILEVQQSLPKRPASGTILEELEVFNSSSREWSCKTVAVPVLLKSRLLSSCDILGWSGYSGSYARTANARVSVDHCLSRAGCNAAAGTLVLRTS